MVQIDCCSPCVVDSAVKTVFILCACMLGDVGFSRLIEKHILVKYSVLLHLIVLLRFARVVKPPE